MGQSLLQSLQEGPIFADALTLDFWLQNCERIKFQLFQATELVVISFMAALLFLPFSRLVVSDSFATSWTVGCQASLSMGLFRQEYWSEFPFPPPGDLPDPGIEPTSLALVGGFFTISATLGSPWQP